MVWCLLPANQEALLWPYIIRQDSSRWLLLLEIFLFQDAVNQRRQITYQLSCISIESKYSKMFCYSYPKMFYFYTNKTVALFWSLSPTFGLPHILDKISFLCFSSRWFPYASEPDSSFPASHAVFPKSVLSSTPNRKAVCSFATPVRAVISQ